MDKPPARSKGTKILKLLQKPASFSLPHPKTIPNNKALFSSPLFPPEVRRRHSGDRSFDTREPTSPKISCIGQIKHKANRSRRACGRPPAPKREKEKTPKKSSSFGLRKMFSRRVGPGRRPEFGGDRLAPAPPVGDLRQFRSGREALAGFDWRKAMVEEEEEEDVLVPFSAPILIGGGAKAAEPKKEVNLWKRRTIGPPAPLLVKS